VRGYEPILSCLICRNETLLHEIGAEVQEILKPLHRDPMNVVVVRVGCNVGVEPSVRELFGQEDLCRGEVAGWT
jgi:hypothetical protein